MAGSCEGKVALITGASRGIGKALAIRMASEGAALGLVSRTIDTETFGSSMRDTLTRLEAIGARAVPVTADLGDPTQSRDAIVDVVEAELGPVDILVNNAMSSPYQRFADFTDDEIRFAQEVNVWAPWQLTRRVLPGMRERGRGWILNMSSGSAEIPVGPPYSALVGVRGTVYGGTKAMLNRWTVSLAIELMGSGVAVNALAPQRSTATEAVSLFVEKGSLRAQDMEPIETMVEAALALCTGDPAVLTARICYSLSLLAELDRPVRDLHGEHLVEGWQPADIPGRIAAQG
jgi:NAD(P)-dependent dehydrogenase (short-subunit alcohol dehydrogenase family)